MMITVTFKIDEKQHQDFIDMCLQQNQNPSSRLRMIINNELSIFSEQERRRKSRNTDKKIVIGEQYSIPPAY